MSILEKIEKARVFEIWLHEDKKILEITEGCDGYFDISLNKQELRQLIKELQSIYEQMQDGKEL